MGRDEGNNPPWLHDDDPERYAEARYMHAWLLHAEGLGYAAIGRRLGVSRDRARTLCILFGRYAGWATRRTHFRLVPFIDHADIEKAAAALLRTTVITNARAKLR